MGAMMTEFEFTDAGGEPGGSNDFDSAEADPGAHGGWIADVERPASSDVDETVGDRDEWEPPDETGELSPTRGDGQSSNWIRVDSRWHPSDVDPNVSD
jgi:hypothetical protein